MSFFGNRKPSENQDGAETPLFSTASVLERRRAEAWLADRVKRGERGVFSEVGVLSPVLAEVLLGRNPDNRILKEGVADKYASDVADGRWVLNGESVKVARDGTLNDGQHRCSAVVRAATPIHTIFTFGVERASRLTLDQGAVRTPGDYLSMEGIPQANNVAAIAALIWQYETHGRVSAQALYRPTKAQVRETYHAHPTISESVTFASKQGVSMVGGKSVVAFCHYLFKKHDRAAADEFISSLISGAKLDDTDPILLCRNRLSGSKRMRVDEKVELIIRAWNHHRSGRRLQKIQLGVKESRKPTELPKVES